MPHPNELLRALSPDILEEWLSQGQRLKLSVNQVFGQPQHPPDAFYFPLNAVLGWMSWLGDGASNVIALVGSEGMISLEPMPGLGQHLVTVCSGDVLQVPARLVAQQARYNPQWSLLNFRNQQSLLTQISQSAVCNQHHSVLQRLLRLVQSILSRTGGQTVRLTHEQMAHLLGTRRERVSQACSMLEKLGAIQQGRGQIRVMDEETLRAQSCPCGAAMGLRRV